MTEFGQKIINSWTRTEAMKAPNISIFIVLVILAGCSNGRKDDVVSLDQSTVTVSGVIENGEDVLVTLDRMGANAFIPIDSVRCDENGEFEFHFQHQAMDFYAL